MTKAKSSVMTDFGAPILVLVLICAIMSGLLAFTNSVTDPIIKKAEEEAKKAARIEVLPGADDFLQVEQAGLPDAVTEVYQATNDAGYTFSIVAQGYGGRNTLKMAVGIGMDGKLTGVKVLDHKETQGLGSKITTDEKFYGQFPGLDAAGAAGADTISGATFSSNYYKDAIAAAFVAFELVRG